MFFCGFCFVLHGELFIISEVIGKLDKLLHVNKESIAQTNVVMWKSKKHSSQWEETRGVWERICFAISSEKIFSTDFRSTRSASRLKTCIMLSIFSPSYTWRRNKILPSQRGDQNWSASVLSQTWESKLLFIQMGAPERRLKPTAFFCSGGWFKEHKKAAALLPGLTQLFEDGGGVPFSW